MTLIHRPGRTLLGPALALALLSPTQGFAGACPTASFDQILALGSCVIGDASFDFTQPQIGNSVYFNGPFAGTTGLGPAAATLMFTPDIGPGHAGFSLAGNFFAFGQALRNDPFYGGQVTGNFYNEVLGYIGVTPGAGMGLSGYSVALGGAQVTQNNTGSIAKADLNSATAIVNDAGFSRLADSRSFDSPLVGRQLFLSNIATYERSGSSADVAGFAAVSYGFSEVAISGAVPEPSSLASMLAGLAGLTGLAWASRRITTRRTPPGSRRSAGTPVPPAG